MKYLKVFEEYKGVVTRNDIEFIATNTPVYGNFHRAIDFVYEKINDLINRTSPKITLYRILHLDNKTDLDRDNLGIHYSLDDSYDEYFLYDIGILDYNDTEDELENKLENLYKVKVQVHKDDISIIDTVKHLLAYPHEDEITLKEESQPIILSIEKREYDESELKHP